jgi:hypothetical protein
MEIEKTEENKINEGSVPTSTESVVAIKTFVDDDIVILNAGGLKKYPTRISTLRPSSYFRGMFGLNGTKSTTPLKDGTYFVDCAPDIMHLLLELLRTQEVCYDYKHLHFTPEYIKANCDKFDIPYFDSRTPMEKFQLEQKTIITAVRNALETVITDGYTIIKFYFHVINNYTHLPNGLIFDVAHNGNSITVTVDIRTHSNFFKTSTQRKASFDSYFPKYMEGLTFKGNSISYKIQKKEEEYVTIKIERDADKEEEGASSLDRLKESNKKRKHG